ncbi:hypothetical protein XCR1_4290008 [Xenorhabdus cabanillasii JM26]|uniref:Uncharacterized protein n=1 Tax=Xenorhabdus cabanillasii JM26 TaxID=1427517 RepID=W1JAW3_9GAMM|nr:hypothetical protein XCR1_4290008 [Xenorhabdus cabanillasii JM26]
MHLGRITRRALQILDLSSLLIQNKPKQQGVTLAGIYHPF